MDRARANRRAAPDAYLRGRPFGRPGPASHGVLRSRRLPATLASPAAGGCLLGGYPTAARRSYGMAVTVLASSSLFSLRRCVSKRSPTLKDVMLTNVRPVRL